MYPYKKSHAPMSKANIIAAWIALVFGLTGLLVCFGTALYAVLDWIREMMRGG